MPSQPRSSPPAGRLPQSPVLAVRVPALIGLYFALVSALKLALYTGASPDEGEQLLQAQFLRLGYDLENPPLFAWIVHCLNPLTGAGLPTVTLVRVLALALYYLGLWQAARHVLRRRDLAPLAAFSPVALWFIGWDALRNYSHSLLMLAALAWLAALLLSWRTARRRRQLAHGLAVGVTCAVGLLAKYSFVLPAATLVIAAVATDRAWRRCLLSRAGALALGITVLLVLPHGLWLALQSAEFGRGMSALLQGARVEQPAAPGAVAGVMRALSTLLQFSLPFALLFPLVFARPLVSAAAGRRAARPAARRWLDMHLGLMLGSLLVGAALLQSAAMRQHHHFIFALLPLWAFARLPLQLPERALRIWSALLMALAFACLGGLVYRALSEGATCRKCHDVMPYAAYAAQLRALGFEDGPIISYSSDFIELGENLRRYFPRAWVFSTKHPQLAFDLAEAPGRHCLVVWDASRERDRAQQLMSAPPALMTTPLPPAVRTGVIAAPLAFSTRAAPAMGYALIERGVGGCPTAAGAAR